MLEDNIKIGLTFDDVLLVPAISDVLPGETDVNTQFTRNITLNIPIVSAAMDSVTEAKLAVAIAQEGGMGIIYRNLSIQQQVEEVKKVKRYESAVTMNPTVVKPETPIEEILALMQTLGYSGFPVVKNGKLVGIITRRDL